MKYIIGIDIGGTSVKGGVVDESGNIIFKAHCHTRANIHYSEIIADIAELVRELISGAELDESDIKGIGMGIPGTIDSKNGIIIYSNNINFENVPIRAELKKYFDFPVYMSNDANAAALGEAVFGSDKSLKDIVFITLGTGVGTGIIIGGKLFEGGGSAGAEGGHLILVKDGEPCTCGRNGCWEAYASATGLIRETKAAMAADKDSKMLEVASQLGKISGKTAFIAAKSGDRAAQAVVDNYLRCVGEGLVDLANIFRPQAILIGGGISNEGDYIMAPLQKMLDEEAYGSAHGNPRVIVKKASLVNDAGILGAASLVMAN